jgi:ubiquinone/menaquinone biosynthesis C-methylase UbiE
MSEPYVRYAGRHLKRWSRINLAVGNAESLPTPDESQDAVTSIFVFHELPPKVPKEAPARNDFMAHWAGCLSRR